MSFHDEQNGHVDRGCCQCDQGCPVHERQTSIKHSKVRHRCNLHKGSDGNLLDARVTKLAVE